MIKGKSDLGVDTVVNSQSMSTRDTKEQRDRQTDGGTDGRRNRLETIGTITVAVCVRRASRLTANDATKTVA